MANTPNISEIIKKAQEMQQKMQNAQNDLANIEISGESGGGLVKIIMTGRHDVTRVTIDESMMRENKEILEDLIAAAINDAVRKVEKASQDKLSNITGSMELPKDFNLFGK